MKNISTRSKTSNNHQVRSQKSTILHDNKKVEWMTSMMNENFNRIWFHHSILQKKNNNWADILNRKSDFIKKEAEEEE